MAQIRKNRHQSSVWIKQGTGYLWKFHWLYLWKFGVVKEGFTLWDSYLSVLGSFITHKPHNEDFVEKKIPSITAEEKSYFWDFTCLIRDLPCIYMRLGSRRR